jgi:N-acetylmuramoyl-L-alanine amidase CwlA
MCPFINIFPVIGTNKINFLTSILNNINQYKCDDCEKLFEARFNIDGRLLWETYKLIIRGRTISYSSFKKKERDKRENDLENTLQKLQLGQENNTSISSGFISPSKASLSSKFNILIKGLFSSTNMKWLSLTTVLYWYIRIHKICVIFL